MKLFNSPSYFSPRSESCDTKCEFLLNAVMIFFFKGKQFCLRIFFTSVLKRIDLYCSHKMELSTYVINMEFIPLVNLKELCQNTGLDHRSPFY